MNFHQKFQNFLKFSQTIVFFVQKRENLTHGIESFCKIGENKAFFAIFFRNFLQNFEISPASGGGGVRPPDPLQGRIPY